MNLIDILKQRVEMNAWYLKEQGYNYQSPEDFVLREGFLFDSEELSEVELSHFEAIIKKSKSKKIGECFYNAQLLTLFDDTEQIEYWEGFTLSKKIPILHGFNVLNGKVIDVTHNENGKPILGVFTNKEYLGVKFSKNRIIERIRNGKDSTTFIDDFREEWPVLKEKWIKE